MAAGGRVGWTISWTGPEDVGNDENLLFTIFSRCSHGSNREMGKTVTFWEAVEEVVASGARGSSGLLIGIALCSKLFSEWVCCTISAERGCWW